MLIHLFIALLLWFTGFALFGKFIVPRWKVAGKFLFYISVSLLLSHWLGDWSLIWIVGHQLLGIGGHIWWCRRNGINWLTCEPRARYLELRPWAGQDGFGNSTPNDRQP